MTPRTLPIGLYSDEGSDPISAVESAIASERRRIARELHDGIAQELTALGLALGSAHGSSDLDYLRQLAGRARREVRRQMTELHPQPIDHDVLVASMRDLARRTRRETGVTVLVDATHLSFSPGTAGYDLLRVAGEAVKNACQHGDARHIEITLCDVVDPAALDCESIRLRVEDDGHGFDSSQLQIRADGTGRGLSFMRERIEELYGDFCMQSTVGEGTCITAQVAAQWTAAETDRRFDAPSPNQSWHRNRAVGGRA